MDRLEKGEDLRRLDPLPGGLWTTLQWGTSEVWTGIHMWQRLALLISFYLYVSIGNDTNNTIGSIWQEDSRRNWKGGSLQWRQIRDVTTTDTLQSLPSKQSRYYVLENVFKPQILCTAWKIVQFCTVNCSLGSWPNMQDYQPDARTRLGYALETSMIRSSLHEYGMLSLILVQVELPYFETSIVLNVQCWQG